MSRQRDEKGRFAKPEPTPKGDADVGDDSGVNQDLSQSPGSEEAPADPFQEFLQALDSDISDIKSRIAGLEQTIGQMGAEPATADPLKGLMDGPLGPSIKDIIKEVPGMIKNLTGGGTTDLARLIADEIDVREKERLKKRASKIAEAITSDRELQLADREEK